MKLLTEGLYAELLDTDVGVSVIMPGAVATDIAENSGVTIAGADTAAAGMRMTSARMPPGSSSTGSRPAGCTSSSGRDSRLMNAATASPHGRPRG